MPCFGVRSLTSRLDAGDGGTDVAVGLNGGISGFVGGAAVTVGGTDVGGTAVGAGVAQAARVRHIVIEVSRCFFMSSSFIG